MSKNIKYINSKVIKHDNNKLYFANETVLIIIADFMLNGKIEDLHLLNYEISKQKVKFNFENNNYIEITPPYLTDELFCVINKKEKYRCLLTKDNLFGIWIGLED